MMRLTEREILANLRDWEECAAVGAPGLKLTFNVPADAFVRLSIARMIPEERPKAANQPGMILEVTEDQVVNNLKMANEVANELCAQQCSRAIDDFGAGYCSLAWLRQFPFSEWKFNRACVTDCRKTIAEGFETSHDAHKLQGVGCQVGQGYRCAKPMSKDDLVATISRRMIGVPRPAPQRGFMSRLIGGSSAKA